MKITVFTSNQPRHIKLIEKLSKISSELYAIIEVTTVFPGVKADFYSDSETMKEYFSKVDELTDLKNTPVWDDLTPGLKKVFAKKGSKTTFGDVMRYAYNQGSGYSMKYFPYNIAQRLTVSIGCPQQYPQYQ